jgi:hypothetical protein
MVLTEAFCVSLTHLRTKSRSSSTVRLTTCCDEFRARVGIDETGNRNVNITSFCGESSPPIEPQRRNAILFTLVRMGQYGVEHAAGSSESGSGVGNEYELEVWESSHGDLPLTGSRISVTAPTNASFSMRPDEPTLVEVFSCKDDCLQFFFCCNATLLLRPLGLAGWHECRAIRQAVATWLKALP